MIPSLCLLALAAVVAVIFRRVRLYRESRRHLARLYDLSRYPF